MAGGGNSTGGALPHDAAVALYLSLSLILITARILGEIAMKLNQPAVMGELLAGVLLGKTCLYYISPSFFAYLFGSDSKNASALAGVTSICVTLYMLIAGLEMNMKNAMRKKVPSVSVGFFALAVPFALGFIFCYFFPSSFGLPEGKSVVNFSLFTATAMAITALPVAAKTLRDLHLFRTDLGVVVMSAAVFDDILGWSLFAVTLAVSSGNDAGNGMSIGANIAVSIVYVIFILTAGSFIVNRALPYLQAYFSYPPGELGFVCLFALASSTFALWVGLHNTLGAFVAGAAIGNSRHFRQEMREILDTFVSFMLAPIFFGSVCINANFATDFDAGVVFAILFLSCAGKLLGGFIGAKITGSNMREACAIAACMNARGAMELILAQVARDAGIIDGKVFVALVFMAIVTSVIPGPLLRRILKRPKNIVLHAIIPTKGFLRSGGGDSMQSCIRELADALGHPEVVDNAIERELTKGSMVWDKVAISSVIAKDIKKPAAGISILQKEINWIGRRSRIESDEEDLVKYVVLLIVPDFNHTIEFDLIKEFSQIFSNVKFREELDKVNSFVELKALFQIEKFRSHMAGHNPNPTPVIALRETGMLAVDVNDIIQGSPMATPAQPDIFLSPKAMNILQSTGMEAVGDKPVETGDLESFIEFKKRPSRRGTAASVRATIEEYVGPIADPNAYDGTVNPEGKHTGLSQPEDFGNSTSVRSDKSVSLQTGDSDQTNGVTMDERETQTETLATTSIAGLVRSPPPHSRGTSPRPNQDDDQIGLV